MAGSALGLSSARLQAIVWSADVARSTDYYRDVLELPLIGDSHGAAVFTVGGGELRVSPVPSTEPSAHTVLGFAVLDLSGTVARLAAKGVRLERFEGFGHAEDGSWTAPDGTMVAWFRDPDGNLLSLVQYTAS